jgi:hypothetical protein
MKEEQGEILLYQGADGGKRIADNALVAMTPLIAEPAGPEGRADPGGGEPDQPAQRVKGMDTPAGTISTDPFAIHAVRPRPWE